MYEFEVLTVRDLDFEDNSGKSVSGMQLWLIGSSAEPAWNGWEVVKIWIPDGHKLESDVAQLKRGDNVRIQFDRRGKPIQLELLG